MKIHLTCLAAGLIAAGLAGTRAEAATTYSASVNVNASSMDTLGIISGPVAAFDGG